MICSHYLQVCTNKYIHWCTSTYNVVFEVHNQEDNGNHVWFKAVRSHHEGDKR